MVAPIIRMPNTEKHSGVSGIPTQLLVLHSGESPLRGGYAQSLTQWANVPLSQGGPEASWHWFVDPIAIVSMVDPMCAAWHASEANPMSEGFEQSGYARFSRAEWLTSEGRKQIDNLAWIMAQRAKANGIPAVWLTTAQVNAITSGRDRTTKGLCTHRQIDPETRTDPGDHYPFDVLTARINAYMGGAATVPQGNTTKPAPAKEDDDMPTYKRVPAIIRKPGTTRLGRGKTWYLKDKAGRLNLNLAPVPGLYDIDLFLQGTGLGEGQSLTVQFIVVSKGKRSGYYTQQIVGSKTGSFRGALRYSAPVPKGAALEVAVTSSVAGPDLTTYGADIKLWQ